MPGLEPTLCERGLSLDRSCNRSTQPVANDWKHRYPIGSNPVFNQGRRPSRELRDMLTEIRIIKDLGTHTRTSGLPVLTDAELASPEVLDPVTIAYLPAKRYPTGTLNFAHTFPENGKFIGIVTVRNEHGQIYVSQFPFEVGQPIGKTVATYGMMIAVGIAAVYGLWHFGGKQKPAVIPKKPA
jgi:hypothetical protein